MTQHQQYPNEGVVEVILHLERGGARHRLVHRLTQPSAAEWNRFFEQAAVTRREKRRLVVEDRSAAEAVAIYDARIESIEGYLAGGKPLMDRADWKSRVPAAHKRQALERLGEVEAAPPSAESQGYETGGEVETEIALTAQLNGASYRLIHRLRAPDAALLRRYESERAMRSIDSRGESPGAAWLSAACKLYDALVIAVEGYANPQPTRVPPLHKKAAVDRLLGARDGWAGDTEGDGEGWEKN